MCSCVLIRRQRTMFGYLIIILTDFRREKQKESRTNRSHRLTALCLQTGSCCSHIITSITCRRGRCRSLPSDTNEVSFHITSLGDAGVMPSPPDERRLRMHELGWQASDSGGRQTRRGDTLSTAHVIVHTDEGLTAGCRCGRLRLSYGPHLWLGPLNGIICMREAPPAALKTYRNASPPCCHVVWLWLDLKTEALGLIRYEYTAAHAGHRLRWWVSEGWGGTPPCQDGSGFQEVTSQLPVGFSANLCCLCFGFVSHLDYVYFYLFIFLLILSFKKKCFNHEILAKCNTNKLFFICYFCVALDFPEEWMELV